MSLMISISGIRGILGEDLTPETVVKYSAAFAEYCKRKATGEPVVVLGRDGRATGKALTHIISSTLLCAGVNVRAVGIASTPTIALAVEQTGATGGISVTASHNPMEWNGMKFFGPDGLFLNARENRELLEIAESRNIRFASWDTMGRQHPDASWISKHIYAVITSPYVDISRIQARKFKIVVDCVNAAGGIMVPDMLREFGCEVIEMNCDMTGVFAHAPEPIPENLTELCERVKIENADLGIAVDPDVDRLVLINEKGEPYGEEYTIATAVKFVLEKERLAGHTFTKSVVVNLSTTRAVDDIASAFGAKVFRSPVGEINVVNKMKEVGAIIGGEGSGGVILPSIHYGRDAIVGIGLILQSLAESSGTLSQLKASLPQYSIAKGKIELGSLSPDEALRTIQASAGTDAMLNTDDGLKLDFPNHWVHLRKSNTEPIVRVIAEAKTMKEALGVVESYKTRMTSL